LKSVIDLIPHREPFLFVDRVLEQSENTIKAERIVRADEFYFKGHYPGNPILPGVLLCESMFQAGAILMSSIAELSTGVVPVVTRADKIKFKQMVKPGDVLTISVEFTEKIGPAYCFKGKTMVGGKVASSCEFMCALVSEG